MFLIYCVLFIVSSIQGNLQDQYIFINQSRSNQASTSWTIIGAGPAGISVVGLLLDLGVPGSDITWIDPEFKFGRLGYYETVHSNTKAKVFVEFINSCRTYQRCQ